MELHSPWLLLVALPVLLAALVAWKRPRRGYAVATVSGLAGLRPTLRQRLARLLPLLQVLAALLIVIGLARPRIAHAEAEVPAEGIDIVLSVDLSSSMASTRFGDRSRLEAAREVIGDFVRSREDDRIGLVVFQRDAIPLAPLTSDYEALGEIVDALDTGLLPDGTAIGDGIATGVNMLRESSAASRAVILLTDGQHNTDSIRPEDAAALAQALRIRLYTIGVTSQRTSPDDVDGNLLQAASSQTGGRYFAASNPEELQEVYAEIESLETSRIPGERFQTFTELGPWFVFAGASTLGFAVLLAATWLRRLPS